ncbi:hypothetical protein DFH94DRAFT_763807 [Russula ochroleuca]|uniref:Uncharacterized protein n=1 Tax=Russula ochroleuca TaxID=152965 RepID=A0A9P5K1H3_9AGAM|nr:hypothetical protein DFH94DRAFT_763807 [Russula ochroleuca]
MRTLSLGLATYCTALAGCFCGLKGRGRICIRHAGRVSIEIVWTTPRRKMWWTTNGTVRFDRAPTYGTGRTLAEEYLAGKRFPAAD